MRAFSLFPTQTLIVLVGDLLLSALIYSVSAAYLIQDPLLGFLADSNGWLRLLLAVISIVGGIYFNELYSAVRVRSRISLILQLSHVFGLSLVIQTLLVYLNANWALPRRVVLAATLIGLPAFFLWRLAYSAFLWKLFGTQSVLLVGNGPLAQELARLIASNPDRAMSLAGYVGDAVPIDAIPGIYLGRFEELPAITDEVRPHRVVVACSDRRDGGMPIAELLTVRHRGVPIEEGARLYELLCNRICASEFSPSQFIFDQTLKHRPGSVALQSIYINLMALVGIAVLSPLLIVLSILVKLSTRGPILNPVPCVGYRQIPFSFLRFRTTRRAPGSNRESVTRLGAFLRKTRLEVLPALFNLLRGEMAIVGPRLDRQEIGEELANRIPFYEQRYALRPGLTGWSQINMDRQPEAPDALISLEYDLYYLKNMSLSLDAYVLLHRLRHMFTIA